MAESSTLFEAAAEYWRDAAQRGVLFMETLNERGNTYVAQSAKTAPHVLNFPVEILRDGRMLERPANYALVRIVPPNDVTIDPVKPPIVVVDPRAGHGPGIGGMKPESEIGVALRAGHPVYFIGFLPKPEPGQTIEDVCHAEGTFIEDVAQRHAEAEGKPIVIANCQAGWQTMMMAAIRPDLTGPIILAGSPLSYWAGVRGKNPMRYLGGLLGGTWLTELSGDLGAGIFDGAHLVANFESLNPANTYWTKPYNRLFEDRHRTGAVPRLRDLVGQPGSVECGRDAVDRGQPVRRQQAVERPDSHVGGRACRFAQNQIANRRFLLLG